MRIVVTGLGMISAVGGTVDECWENIKAGTSGLREITTIPHDGLASVTGGEIVSLPAADGPDVDRTLVIGCAALGEALSSAGLASAGPYPRDRFGLAVGTSLGGARSGEAFHRQWLAHGLDSADPKTLKQYPLHATADYLAARFGLFGPRAVHSNACAAGAVAIVNGVEYLRTGAADVVVAGGVDPLAYLSFGGFSSLGALADGACAPYTRSDGLSLGEGAGFLVLERREAALARGATVVAELVGYGLSADAHHATAPDPRGRGALAAVGAALTMAGATVADIGYINGHGTGTPANDGGERRIIESLGPTTIPMSSTKSLIGHTLGAAGAVEAVVTVLALRDQMLPPTAVPDGDETPPTFDIVPGKARAATFDLALSNSFAFGGNNATLAFARPNAPDRERPPTLSRDVVVRALEVLVGDAEGEASACERLFAESPTYTSSSISVESHGSYPAGEISDRAQTRLLDPSYMRKLDPVSKRAASATASLLKRAGLSRAEVGTTGLIFATSTGPLSTVEAFQRGLIQDKTGNPRLFPNTVMNAAPGHVALLLGLKGPTATYCSGSTGGMSALHFGRQLIASGACDRVIVLAAEEVTEASLAGYARFRRYLSRDVVRPFADSGCIYSGAAVAVLLEAHDVAPAGSALARLTGFGFAGDDSGCGDLSHDPAAMQRALTTAAVSGGGSLNDVDVVVAAANGRLRPDSLERDAIVGLGLDDRPVSAPQAVFGETLASGPLLGLAQAVWMGRRREVPAAGHFPSARVPPAALGEGPLRVLVNSLEVGGSYQSLLVTV